MSGVHLYLTATINATGYMRLRTAVMAVRYPPHAWGMLCNYRDPEIPSDQIMLFFLVHSTISGM